MFFDILCILEIVNQIQAHQKRFLKNHIVSLMAGLFCSILRCAALILFVSEMVNNIVKIKFNCLIILLLYAHYHFNTLIEVLFVSYLSSL